MSERTGARGVVLVLAALVVLAAAWDLLARRDSLLRSLTHRDRPAPVERMIRDVRDELPRNRPR